MAATGHRPLATALLHITVLCFDLCALCRSKAKRKKMYTYRERETVDGRTMRKKIGTEQMTKNKCQFGRMAGSGTEITTTSS